MSRKYDTTINCYVLEDGRILQPQGLGINVYRLIEPKRRIL